MNNLGTKTLETERLILRKFKKSDLLSVYNNWASDERMTIFLGWIAHKNIEETKRIMNIWLNNYRTTSYNWNIIIKDENESIGNISVINSNTMFKDNKAYIYYCIGSKYWKKGYTTEAVRVVINYLINEVGIKEIAAGYDSLNIASGKVLEKVGMKRIATLENMGLNPNNGKYENERYEYSIKK